MDEDSGTLRASYAGFQISVENRDFHHLSQSEIAGAKRISRHLSRRNTSCPSAILSSTRILVCSQTKRSIQISNKKENAKPWITMCGKIFIQSPRNLAPMAFLWILSRLLLVTMPDGAQKLTAVLGRTLVYALGSAVYLR